jgi:hypothetical protein
MVSWTLGCNDFLIIFGLLLKFFPENQDLIILIIISGCTIGLEIVLLGLECSV